MGAKKTAPERYVYLMERVTQKEKETGWKREIKIGISKTPYIRNRDVDRGIPGKVIMLGYWKVPNARKVEQALHKKYKAHNFHVKDAEDGAGKTEFFRFRNRQIKEVKAHLKSLEETETRFSMPVILLFILSLIYSVLIIWGWATN